MKRWTGTALQSGGQQLSRVVDAVYSKPCFREQVCVAALTAWRIEDARAKGESEPINDARSLSTIALGCEYRSVFKEVMRIEIAFPPLRLAAQKNTGSRYAPKTSSIAARIS
jgi:hypothetical protein